MKDTFLMLIQSYGNYREQTNENNIKRKYLILMQKLNCVRKQSISDWSIHSSNLWEIHLQRYIGKSSKYFAWCPHSFYHIFIKLFMSHSGPNHLCFYHAYTCGSSWNLLAWVFCPVHVKCVYMHSHKQKIAHWSSKWSLLSLVMAFSCLNRSSKNLFVWTKCSGLAL